MTGKVTSIQLQMPFNLGGVNCYLIQTGKGYILVDTGSPNQRTALVKELKRCGCQPGQLQLIFITHGDFDHTGNAAYLRTSFDARIAMHAGDLGMAERGDMFWNRKKGNALLRRLAPLFIGFGSSDRFKPDLLVDEAFDLSQYGLDGKVLHLPGHSKGSLGLLLAKTASGSGTGLALFCGDLLENQRTPALNSIMDDLPAGRSSVERLNALAIETVYPGHGAPWQWVPIPLQ